MIADDTPRAFAKGSKAHPLLIVVQNNGGGGTPNIVIGISSSPIGLRQTGIIIGPGAASPQLTVTDVYFIISGTAGTPQVYNVRVDNL